MRAMRGEGLRTLQWEELPLLRGQGPGREGMRLWWLQCKRLLHVRAWMRCVQIPSRAQRGGNPTE